jgi:predicted TIM-barrel fold metal-dependent hydrolase
MWRLDKQWERMRSEVPHVKRPPSEYISENVWFTTQPIEEPENNRHLLDTLRWVGTDRLMFSTDYPHWDFDDPRYAFKVPLSPTERAQIFRDNAKRVYRLP